MELSTFEQKTEEALEDCKGSVKHCAKNALHHLRKAWKISEIDLEMSVFRGITAEEEAASSLFYTLKNQKYKNANKLLFKEHTYKLAVFPYIKSVLYDIKRLNEENGSPFSNPILQHVEHNKRKAVCLHFKVNQADLVATPTPPLHFNISYPETGKIMTFEYGFKQACQGDKFESVLKYVKHVAGERNRILYATESGRPSISGDIPAYLKEQKQKVFTILNIMLMIDPWINEGKSAFVQQGLDSFLFLLEKIQEYEFEPPVDKP